MNLTSILPEPLDVFEPVIKAIIPKQIRPSARQLYRSTFYAGDSVLCPCCGKNFRKFMPFGATRRDNAQCPQCNALERHRLLWLFLKEKTTFFQAPLKVLHIAPETLFQTIFKTLPNLDYVSADLMSPNAMVKMDITDIGGENNVYDTILCNHVLEHVNDDQKAMSELCRVLKPGGWAILQVPIDTSRETTLEDPSITSPQDRERYYGQDDHLRLYGRDYVQKLEAAGFSVEVNTYVQQLGPVLSERYGLDPTEDIYFCTKN